MLFVTWRCHIRPLSKITRVFYETHLTYIKYVSHVFLAEKSDGTKTIMGRIEILSSTFLKWHSW